MKTVQVHLIIWTTSEARNKHTVATKGSYSMVTVSVVDSASLLTLFHVCFDLIATSGFIVIQNT